MDFMSAIKAMTGEPYAIENSNENTPSHSEEAARLGEYGRNTFDISLLQNPNNKLYQAISAIVLRNNDIYDNDVEISEDKKCAYLLSTFTDGSKEIRSYKPEEVIEFLVYAAYNAVYHKPAYAYDVADYFKEVLYHMLPEKMCGTCVLSSKVRFIDGFIENRCNYYFKDRVRTLHKHLKVLDCVSKLDICMDDKMEAIAEEVRKSIPDSVQKVDMTPYDYGHKMSNLNVADALYPLSGKLHEACLHELSKSCTVEEAICQMAFNNLAAVDTLRYIDICYSNDVIVHMEILFPTDKKGHFEKMGCINRYHMWEELKHEFSYIKTESHYTMYQGFKFHVKLFKDVTSDDHNKYLSAYILI